MKFYQIFRFGVVILIFSVTCFAQSNSHQVILISFFEENSTIYGLDENDSPERRILAKLRAKGFTDVSVKTEKGMIILRGTVPKGKMAEAVQTAIEANNGKPIKNEMTEK